MILGSSHETHGGTVDESEQRALGTRQALFDNDGGAGFTEVAREAIAHSLKSLLLAGGDDDTLTGGKAVSLHHEDLCTGGKALRNIGFGTGLLGKAAIRSSGNTVTLHELLGEALGPLHLCTLGTRAKSSDALGAHRVGNAGHKRGLGTDDHKPHAVLGGIIGHRGRVVDVELDVRRNGSRSTVAGSNVQLIAQRRGLERDRDGMLATARTQKQDIHGAVSPQSL